MLPRSVVTIPLVGLRKAPVLGTEAVAYAFHVDDPEGRYCRANRVLVPTTLAPGTIRQRAMVTPSRLAGSTEEFVRSQVTRSPVAGYACTLEPRDATRTLIVGEPMLPSVVPV